jgi:hypothetical protein
MTLNVCDAMLLHEVKHAALAAAYACIIRKITRNNILGRQQHFAAESTTETMTHYLNWTIGVATAAFLI